MPSLVRHDTCRRNCAVERGLAVSFCAQLHHYNWPYYPAAWFRCPSSVMVPAERFQTSQGPCRAILHKWGLAKSPTCDMRLTSSRLWAISWMRVHWQSSMADFNYFTELKMTQLSGWNRGRLIQWARAQGPQASGGPRTAHVLFFISWNNRN